MRLSALPRVALLAALAGCGPATIEVSSPPGETAPDGEDSGAPEPEDSGERAPDAEDLPDPCGEVAHPAVVINELLSANVHGLEDADGDTPDWIEIANRDVAAADLSGWTLSDDAGDPGKWALPGIALEPGEVALFLASGEDRIDGEVHTSFSLSATGEEVLLSAADGCPVDLVEPVRLYGDVSYGRPLDAPDTWAFFLEPTPGQANTTEARPGFAPTPRISPGSGFRADPVEVEVACDDGAAALRLTWDGAAPTEASDAYEGPFEVDATSTPAVIRARAWVDGLWPSRIASATYSADPSILDDGLKVVSLVIDPFDLYDVETGIYTYGPPDYTPDYPYFGANFWEDWERDAHVQVWEPDGALVIDQDTGVKIHGGYTRAFEQKSFRILPRAAYGPEHLDYAFFPDEPIESFPVIVLEGAGDWCPTHTENAFIDQLFRDGDGVRFPTLDAQAWEPAVVYLNGAFWGLYAFREKLDEHYIAAHHGADPDELDRIECTADGTDDWWRVNQGDWEAFDAMNAFVIDNDLSDPDAWARFQAMADIDNLATAVLAEGYWGNSDWWDNNLKMWRPREDGAPFRWMVFDLGHGWPSPTTDHIGTSAGWSGPGLPIADALENEAFRVLLANQGAEFRVGPSGGVRGPEFSRRLRHAEPSAPPVTSLNCIT